MPGFGIVERYDMEPLPGFTTTGPGDQVLLSSNPTEIVTLRQVVLRIDEEKELIGIRFL